MLVLLIFVLALCYFRCITSPAVQVYWTFVHGKYTFYMIINVLYVPVLNPPVITCVLHL